MLIVAFFPSLFKGRAANIRDCKHRSLNPRTPEKASQIVQHPLFLRPLLGSLRAGPGLWDVEVLPQKLPWIRRANRTGENRNV